MYVETLTVVTAVTIFARIYSIFSVGIESLKILQPNTCSIAIIEISAVILTNISPVTQENLWSFWIRNTHWSLNKMPAASQITFQVDSFKEKECNFVRFSLKFSVQATRPYWTNDDNVQWCLTVSLWPSEFRVVSRSWNRQWFWWRVIACFYFLATRVDKYLRPGKIKKIRSRPI